MRKLASLQKIKKLELIEGADRIEVATINGWKVVVQKDLFKVGDSCVYFEIDSVLPIEHFSELENIKGRIRTIRLRGQISQGYCISMDRFWDIVDITTPGLSKDVGFGILSISEGSDVTRFLKVEKYDPPITFKGGDSKGKFPSHVLPKTNEDRIQSNLNYLDRMSGRPWVATVKYDGSSGTFGFIDGEFIASSHNFMKKDSDNVFWNIARKYKMQENLPEWAIVQGEICGPGIQKNRLKLSEIGFYVFRVYDKLKKQYLLHSERLDFCLTHKLNHVETDYINDNFDLSLDDLLLFAEGKYHGSEFEREGIVIEANEHVETEFGGHFSFKVISNRFLLK